MTIEFNCPECNKLLRTPDDKAGRTASCPACGSSVDIPRIELDDINISSSDIYGDNTDDEQPDDHKDTPPATGKGSFESVFSTSADNSTSNQQDDNEFEELDEFDDDDDISSGTKQCPMCGASISARSKKCSRCGENLSHRRSSEEGNDYDPHRGGLILALGIASFFTCCIFLGVAAWVMGNQDIREIDLGHKDPAGKDLTQAGRILGIINVILQAGMVLFFCLLAIVAG